MEKKLVVGYDLQEGHTQLSYLMPGMKEPESVSMTSDTLNYLIPTVLARTERGWLMGEEALTEHTRSGSPLVSGLLSAVQKGEDPYFEEYTAKELLEIFLEKTLLLVPGLEFIARQIESIEFCLPTLDKVLIDAVSYCMERLGVRQEKLHIHSFCACSAYYAMSQNKELWQNDVVFLDFSKEGLWYRRMHLAKEQGSRQGARFVIMEKKEYTGRFDYTLLETEEGRIEADEAFLVLAKELLDRQQVSCVYLVGEGFYCGEWAVNSLKFICQRRRTFVGRNLYTKGACYAAWDRIHNKAFSNFCFVCEGRIAADVGISIRSKEGEGVFWLAKAGMPWHEVDSSVECILDNGKEVQCVIVPVTAAEERTETISLEEIPVYQRRMTRLEIVLTFRARAEAILQIKDLGFGSLYEGSGRTICKELRIESGNGERT